MDQLFHQSLGLQFNFDFFHELELDHYRLQRSKHSAVRVLNLFFFFFFFIGLIAWTILTQLELFSLVLSSAVRAITTTVANHSIDEFFFTSLQLWVSGSVQDDYDVYSVKPDNLDNQKKLNNFNVAWPSATEGLGVTSPENGFSTGFSSPNFVNHYVVEGLIAIDNVSIPCDKLK